MPLSLSILSAREAMDGAMAALAIEGALPATHRALVADHLRAACEADGARDARGVFTGRLTDMIEANLGGLLGPAEVRPLAKSVLEGLGETGDLWRAPGGYWHSTPPRVVSLAGGPSFLLGALPSRTGNYIAAGAVRYATTRSGALFVEDFDDWLGRTEPLPVWMTKALKAYRQRLQPAAVPADHLEIYAPDQAVRQSRSRWVEAREADLGSVTLRLCRAQATQTAIYNRPYYLGDFGETSDGLLLRAATPVTHEHARRFRFAFDDAFAANRSVSVKRDADIARCTIAKDLPPEEQRVLALGWEEGEAPSPSVYRMAFPMRAMPFVAHALDRLGIRLGGQL